MTCGVVPVRSRDMAVSDSRQRRPDPRAGHGGQDLVCRIHHLGTFQAPRSCARDHAASPRPGGGEGVPGSRDQGRPRAEPDAVWPTSSSHCRCCNWSSIRSSSSPGRREGFHPITRTSYRKRRCSSDECDCPSLLSERGVVHGAFIAFGCPGHGLLLLGRRFGRGGSGGQPQPTRARWNAAGSGTLRPRSGELERQRRPVQGGPAACQGQGLRERTGTTGA